MSMPVRFPRRLGHGPGGLKGVAKVAKQERIARSYALRVPLLDRPMVFDITEQTSFDLDKVWQRFRDTVFDDTRSREQL